MTLHATYGLSYRICDKRFKKVLLLSFTGLDPNTNHPLFPGLGPGIANLGAYALAQETPRIWRETLLI